MMLVMNFTMIAIICFGGIRIDRGEMQAGNLMAFLQYAMQIMFSLVMFSIWSFIMLPCLQGTTRNEKALNNDPRNARKNPKYTEENWFIRFHFVFFVYFVIKNI
jgi:ATP-binding cassette subfamily B protein